MKDSECFLQHAINGISARVDGILEEFFREDCDDEELLFLENPQSYFIAITGSSPQEDRDANYAKDAFDSYYEFPKVLREDLSVVIHDSLDSFKEFVINWYKHKKGHVETDIEMYSKYDRILVVFNMMDSH